MYSPVLGHNKKMTTGLEKEMYLLTPEYLSNGQGSAGTLPRAGGTSEHHS